MYWLTEHVVQSAQVRSDESAQGAVSNCVTRQVVQFLHAAAEVDVAGAVWYWYALHAFCALQSREARVLSNVANGL